LPEIFISYARANEAVAKRVEAGLKGAGFEAWRDDQLPAHSAYSQIIEQRLSGAAAVVVLWSEDAAQSQWVQAEADFARTRGKLVQAQLDHRLPPLPFNQIQCADLKNWRGHRRHKGWLKLIDGVTAVVRREQLTPSKPNGRSRWTRPSQWAAAAFALVLAAVLLLVAPKFLVPSNQGPTVLAVLPFKTLSAADETLAYGLWEDTREALSRNPQLRIIGRQSAEAMANEKLEPEKYRSRLGVAYLLDGTVRRAGNRVRVSVNLVRTKDGAQLWSATLNRNLDDIFKLQSEVANEIEGRIRGRLAAGGGVKAVNIATSGAVYLIYSEARTALRTRDDSKFVDAHRQLKQAVRMDPNFAPAWATLAVAERLQRPGASVDQPTDNKAEDYARRAITLAPNLASAHAALGFALGNHGPVAEAALRRAIALDPNDVESLNWLATVESRRGNTKETLALYNAAIEVEPLWWPVVLNRLNLLLENNQQSAVDRELSRLDRLGDELLAARSRIQVLEWRGDYSGAVKTGLAFYRRAPHSGREMVRDDLAKLLLELDYPNEAWKFSHAPPGADSVWRNEPSGVARFEALKVPPAAFWRTSPGAEAMSRTYLEMGRGVRLAQWYKDGAGSPEQFLIAVGQPERFVHLAPLVALGLQQSGELAEAERLLSAGEKILSQLGTHSTDRRHLPLWRARLRAVQGRLPEAATSLRQAVDAGWLPPAPLFKPDLNADAPLALLKRRPEFQESRTRILTHMARERAQLGPGQLSGG
jgi:adenylate cyclase